MGTGIAQLQAKKPLAGMVHLLALPGSAGEPSPGMSTVLGRAVSDALALERGGADAIIVENFFDSPFPKDRSPAHTVAAMSLAVQAVLASVSIPVGVNVLRNDAVSAISIAHICGAAFVRINVYVGAAITDQGLIEGAAREAIRCRRELGADVEIWADVFVKHASPMGASRIEDAARDAVIRGRADALIVSGAATGFRTDRRRVERVKAAAPGTRVLIGSGLDEASAADLMSAADGAIVGTSLKENGRIDAPVDEQRVRRLKQAMLLASA